MFRPAVNHFTPPTYLAHLSLVFFIMSLIVCPLLLLFSPSSIYISISLSPAFHLPSLFFSASPLSLSPFYFSLSFSFFIYLFIYLSCISFSSSFIYVSLFFRSSFSPYLLFLSSSLSIYLSVLCFISQCYLFSSPSLFLFLHLIFPYPLSPFILLSLSLSIYLSIYPSVLYFISNSIFFLSVSLLSSSFTYPSKSLPFLCTLSSYSLSLDSSAGQRFLFTSFPNVHVLSVTSFDLLL